MKTCSQASRWILIAAGWLFGIASSLPGQENPVLYRHHSVGAKGFASLEGGTTFKSIWALSQSEDVRAQVYNSLGRVLFKRLAPGVTNDAASLLAPLWKDLVENESWVEVRGEDGKLDWILAVRVGETRQPAWQSNLNQVLSLAKLDAATPGKIEGYPSQTVKFASGVATWAQAGEWVVLSLGAAPSALFGTLVAEIKKSGRPVEGLAGPWLKISADLTRLRRTFPLIPEFAGSRLDLTVTGKGELLRTDAKLDFPQPLDWKAEDWQLPLNTIKDPIVGFSAARGIERLLRKNDEVGLLHLAAFPNQACAWSIASVPYFTFAAAPLTGVSNLMWNALPYLPTLITNHGRLAGQLLWVTNNTQIVWQGMPIMTPVVRPLIDEGREFILAGMMPLPSQPRKPPEELFSFTKKPQVAWYDWEITEERVNAWRRIYMLGLMGFFRESPVTNAPTQRLLDVLGQGKKLGNSISEASVTGPAELTFVRHSHLGFTGVEIVSALRWMDSANFPFTWERTPAMDFKRSHLAHRAPKTNAAGPRVIAPIPPGRQVPGRPVTGGARSNPVPGKTQPVPKPPQPAAQP